MAMESRPALNRSVSNSKRISGSSACRKIPKRIAPWSSGAGVFKVGMLSQFLPLRQSSAVDEEGGIWADTGFMNSPYSMPVSQLSAEARGSFLVRTYSHLALAILLFVGIEVWLFQSGIADSLVGAFSSVNWLLVLGGFMVLSWLATFLAQPSVSRPLQYLGLVLYVALQAVITVPLLDVANQTAPGTIASAAQVTLGGFFLLTGVVVVTRKDFSFLRTFLVWGGIFALGVIVCAVLFQFNLGTWFSVAMVLLAGASILHTTSAVMRDYPEDADLAAAIQLFAGVALMFWYVLRLFLGSRR